MELIDILAIITFIILLFAALWMLAEFYICDRNNCKAFQEADRKAERGTLDYCYALLHEFFNDGIWPLPYIGSAILTPLSIWFLGIEMTVRNFAIIFFVSFATTFFILGFFLHHYVRPIQEYLDQCFNEFCPATNNANVTYADDKPNGVGAIPTVDDIVVCLKDSENINT